MRRRSAAGATSQATLKEQRSAQKGSLGHGFSGKKTVDKEPGRWWWAGLVLLLTMRVLGALNLMITDCDETFNYWEPAHYVRTAVDRNCLDFDGYVCRCNMGGVFRRGSIHLSMLCARISS